MSQGQSRRTSPKTGDDDTQTGAQPAPPPIPIDQAIDVKSAPGSAAGRATLHARLRLICALGNTASIARATGVHPESVRRYVAGDAPSVRFLNNLVESLAISADWLLCGRGQTMLWPPARGADPLPPAKELELIRTRLSEPIVRFPMSDGTGREEPM